MPLPPIKAMKFDNKGQAGVCELFKPRKLSYRFHETLKIFTNPII